MSGMALGASLLILCLFFFALSYPQADRKQLRAFILRNQVSHKRLLPSQSAHAFSYPTLSLLLSLNALESHSLDLARGWLFGYGGLLGRLTGIRASAYLKDNQGKGKQTIRTKLEDVLDASGNDARLLDDAWMMTMPSYMGYEGINPLTVYFCYKADSLLWLIVLEIHNTFDERHAHVLVVGKGENQNCLDGYDHSWTFGRQFHVSPFNDRSGYYTCSVVIPTYSPSTADITHLTNPKPVVRVDLYTAGSPRNLKLTAVLRPLTSTRLSSHSLIIALARAPFGLLLSFSRIAYQAYILHFRKKLDVFVRPEPRAVDPFVEANLAKPRNHPQESEGQGGGLGWQQEGFLEKWSRIVTTRFLTAKAKETGISVSLVSTNPGNEPCTFLPTSPTEAAKETQHLTVYYRSPKFFTILLMAPSAEHALILGQDTEHVFAASSRPLFLTLFSPSSSHVPGRGFFHQILCSIRSRLLPAHLANSVPVPRSHPLDNYARSSTLMFIVLMLYLVESLEKAIFNLVGARFVEGDEPWAAWNRVGLTRKAIDEVGSVRRD